MIGLWGLEQLAHNSCILFQFKEFDFDDGTEYAIPLTLCDTMGIDQLHHDDIEALLDGHISDNYDVSKIS